MEFKKRKFNRLPKYDYSQNGMYFVTVCSFNRENILGEISRDNPCGCPQITYSVLGEITKRQINNIDTNFGMKCDKYIIMPNHIHLILEIFHFSKDGQPQGLSLPRIIGSLKSNISNEYLVWCKYNNIQMGQVWQRSFHDRIIRNDREYKDIWNYIDTNVMRWEEDVLFHD